MIGRGAILGGVLALAGTPLFAHPHRDVDQQVALTLAADHVAAEIVIVPSINAGPTILARIDTDADGTISDVEADAFAQDVLATTELEVAGSPVFSEVTQVDVGDPDALEAGLGSIVISTKTDVVIELPMTTNVSFSIGFAEFDHDWFIQPYLQGSTFNGAAINIERSIGGKITVMLDMGS